MWEPLRFVVVHASQRAQQQAQSSALPKMLKSFWERHAPAWLLEPGWSPALPGLGDQEDGVQPHHLLLCDALGLDSSWYAGLSAQKNGRGIQPP